MRTLILCGGKGTRAYPHTVAVPKPLLEVGDRPVLQHVMEIYAGQGFSDFVLATGYKSEMVRSFAETLPEEWTVNVLDTGQDTNTGGRVFKCREHLGDRFFVTYGDGLGDVDLRALREFHQHHDGLVSLTAVPLPSPYGTIDFDAAGCIERFREKPRLTDHFINAGFFVFEQGAFDHWGGEDLERDVLPLLAERGELFAFRHHGFWKSMDTYKDALELSELNQEGVGPWMRSATPESS